MDYCKKRLFIKSLIISLFAFCILAILVSAFGIYIYKTVEKETHDQIAKVSAEQVEIVNASVSNELSHIKNTAEIITGHTEGEGKLEKAVKYVFDSNAYHDAGIIDETGRNIYGSTAPENITFSNSQPKALFSGDTIVFTVPININDKTYMAYAYANKDKVLNSIFGPYPAIKNCMLVDSAGNIIASPDGSTDKFNKDQCNDLLSRSKNYSWLETADGKEFYTASKTNVNDWSVVTLFEKSELAVQTRYTGTVCLAIMCLFALILLLIVLRVSVKDEKAKLDMYRLAYIDKLTDLPKAEKFKMDGNQILKTGATKYAVILTDVNNFKLVNELFGYNVGDSTLLNMAYVLKNSIGEDEIVCRINNDCFGMLLECGNDEVAFRRRIEKIIQKASSMPNSKDYHLELSCGICYIDDNSMSMATAVDNAMIALKNIKRRNEKISVYDKTFRGKMLEERELENDLDVSLKNGDFLVYLQPKYNLVTDELAGAEALVRWNHPAKGMLSPAKFIPLFETNGSIGKIDLYMLDRVAAKMRQWIDEGKKLYTVSVNLSRVQLNNPNLAEELDRIVTKYNVPKNLINFELTESAYFDDVDRLVATMDDIKKRGYSISMDDFGTGYSSLSLLKQMPLDVLKLDKSFLYGWDVDKNNTKQTSFIKDIIQMARHLDIETLAEGVETQEQRDFLKSAGCDLVQGFFYARPVPVDEYERLLSDK